VNWRKQPLDLTVKRHVPETGGVYVICAHAVAGPNAAGILAALYNAVYVGQAMNLRNRFADHCRGYRDVRLAHQIFRSLDFWFSETGDRNEAEQLLMDALGPPANRSNVIRARINPPVSAQKRR
jgi:excinuclease UvrABC nuclease subunit